MDSTICYSYLRITFKTFLWAAGLPGFLLIFRAVLILLVQRQRSFDEVAAVDGSATIQILYTLICFGVSVFYLIKSRFGKFLLFKSPLFLLFLYHLLALVSIFWSVNSSFSGYRALETISFSLLILSTFSILSKKYSFHEIIKWLTFFFLISILLSAMARARLLGQGFFSFGSLFAEQFNSTPYFFFALLLPIGIWGRSVIVGLSILSFSNTSYFGMALGALFFGMGNKSLKVFLFVLITGLLILLSIYSVETFLQNTIFYGKEGIGFDYTSGRDKIFDLAIQSIKENPLTGFGFVAGETFIINNQFRASISAHNGFVSAILGMGVLGGFLYIFFFAKTFFYVYSKQINKMYKTVFLSSITLIAVHSLGNPGIGSRVYGVWIPSMVLLTFIIGLTYILERQTKYENYLGNS